MHVHVYVHVELRRKRQTTSLHGLRACTDTLCTMSILVILLKLKPITVFSPNQGLCGILCTLCAQCVGLQPQTRHRELLAHIREELPADARFFFTLKPERITRIRFLSQGAKRKQPHVLQMSLLRLSSPAKQISQFQLIV